MNQIQNNRDIGFIDYTDTVNITFIDQIIIPESVKKQLNDLWLFVTIYQQAIDKIENEENKSIR